MVVSVAVHIGTSGWQYAHWRERFYPREVPQRLWLEYYAGRFDTVEVNNAFYRLPALETFEKWRARTPPGFVVAVKASRYLTHIKRLNDPAEAVARLLERAKGLGDRLGPILLQLPPNLSVDLPKLEATLSCFPPSVRVAVEPRHASWFTDDLHELLRAHRAALCLADSPRQRSPQWRTADWGYVRFHYGRSKPESCYGRSALSTWAHRLASLWEPHEDLYAYFNNDAFACALRDARVFAASASRAGLKPTRVPTSREVQVG